MVYGGICGDLFPGDSRSMKSAQLHSQFTNIRQYCQNNQNAYTRKRCITHNNIRVLDILV